MYYDTNENEGRRPACIAALLYALLLAGLMFCVAFRIEAPESAEGIMIDFGDAAAAAGADDTPLSEVSRRTESPRTASDNRPEQVMTQDFEDAPVLEDKRDKQPSETSKTTDTRRDVKPAETEEPQREVNKRALFPGKSPASTSTSQGNAAGAGNQGTPDGEAGADNNAAGTSSSGTSFDLSGRSLREQLPYPVYNIDAEGIVKVDIKVNARGDVVAASYRALGSTTSNSSLVKAALEAARKAKFSESEQETQFGVITYIFKLQ